MDYLKNFNETLYELSENYFAAVKELENTLKEELDVAKELDAGFPGGEFKKNYLEIDRLNVEVSGLKMQIEQLNEKLENKAVYKEIYKDCINAYQKFTDLLKRAGDSISALCTNIKLQLGGKITKTQETLLNKKLGVIESLNKHLSSFIEKEKGKMDACKQKLEKNNEQIEAVKSGVKKKGRTR